MGGTHSPINIDLCNPGLNISRTRLKSASDYFHKLLLLGALKTKELGYQFHSLIFCIGKKNKSTEKIKPFLLTKWQPAYRKERPTVLGQIMLDPKWPQSSRENKQVLYL